MGKFKGEWILGKPYGEIIPDIVDITGKIKGYIVNCRDIHSMFPITKYFLIDESTNKTMAQNNAYNYLRSESNSFERALNRMRYINNTIIEVSLYEDNIEHYMQTDAKFTDIVESYKLRYIDDKVMYQDGEKIGYYASLITNISNPKYIDGCSLNCCQSNIYDGSCYNILLNNETNIIRKISDDFIQVKLIGCNSYIITNEFFTPIVQQYIWYKNKNNSGCVANVNNTLTSFEKLIGITNNIQSGMNKSLENIYFLSDIHEAANISDYISYTILAYEIFNGYDNIGHNCEDVCEYIQYLIDFADHNKNVKYVKNNIGLIDDYKKVKIYLKNIIKYITSNVTFDYDKFIPNMPQSDIKEHVFKEYIKHFKTRIHNYHVKIKILNALINKSEYNPSYLPKDTQIYVYI